MEVVFGHTTLQACPNQMVFSLILQGLSEGDLEEIEEGTTDHAQNVMSAPIDNSNDENDIDEETM